VSDLETIARQAGAAARTEAAARTRHLAFQPEVIRPAGTRRKVLALATAVVALVVAVTLVVGEFAGDRGLVIEPVAPDTGEGVPTDTDADGTEGPPTMAGSAGEFVAVGSMQARCSWCSATLLEDGRVLVVGGTAERSGRTRLLAELYDPTTGTFATTGAPAAGHTQGASARLADGRVLLVSTSGLPAHREDRVRDGAPPAAELYDPATGAFVAVPGMSEDVRDALSGPPVPVALADGRVLLVGPAAAAIFDPDTGELGPTATMTEARHAGSTAALLDDGRVLVAGGAPTAEVYDPVTGSFAPVGDAVSDLPAPTATALEDGRVLLAGGTSSETEQPTAAAQIFDPATDSLTPTGPMATARSMHTAALLPDGRVLVIGGYGDSGDRTVARTAELYDPDTGQFTPAPAPTGDRRAATAITLANGDVLVLGNYPGNGGMWPDTDSPTAEIFSLSGFEQPPGCCPDVPHDLLFEATTAPSDWAELAGAPLHATVTIPPGGIEGATAASFHWTAGGTAESTGGGGDHVLPADCYDGCRLTIPIPVEAETAAEPDLTVTAHLTITYTAAPPVPAERITMRIGAD
jgi:hypothetical protein